MAVPVSFTTVVVSATRADDLLPTGAAGLAKDGGHEVEGLIKWVCMSADDVGSLVEELVGGGLRGPMHPEADIAVVDMMQGPLSRCSWLEVAPTAQGRFEMWCTDSDRAVPPMPVSPTQTSAEYDEEEMSWLQHNRVTPCRALMAYVQRDGRVCPQPNQWDDLWKRMPDRIRSGNGWQPPAPLILSGWWASNDDEKRARLLEHIAWANDHGALKEAAEFLYGLSEDDWHYEDMTGRRGM